MVLRFLPWLVFTAAFILVAVFYTSLSPDIVIARGLFGGSDVVGPKTLFTAFRIPLIDLICALAIEAMRRRNVRTEVQASYRAFWQILLYTVSLKCLFQTLELISAQEYSSVYVYSTVVVVGTGIGLAAFAGRKIVSAFDREDWKLNRHEKLMLTGLLLGYLAAAVVPVVIFR